MSVRGRPNTTAKKTAKPAAVKKTNVKTAKKANIATSALSAVSTGASLLGLTGTKSKGKGGYHKRTASQKLKRAYERRALRQITQGQLGLARRTLRKKRTVI